MSHLSRFLGYLLITLGAGLLLTAVALYFFLAYEGRATGNVAGPLDNSQTLPPDATPTVFWQPSRIQIPKLALDSPVVEATLENGEWRVPQNSAGHLQDTAYPGSTGNVVITGHLDDIRGDSVFARLKELSAGDAITLSGEGRSQSYTVTETKIVKKNDLSVVAWTPESILTLITCAGTYDFLRGEYPERLVVIAIPAEEAVPAP